MATVSSVTKHWITGQEGFTTTLASTISSGATTVPLNSVSGYTNGEQVAFVIEPTDASKKQVFTGTIDTSGVQVTGVVWTEGTNQTHNAGVTVVDYWTATHQAALVKGMKVSHDDDGTLKAGAVDNTAVLADSIVTRAKLASALLTEHNDDWKVGVLPAQSGTIVNNGNRSYDIPFASTVASILSPGMRLRTTRTVTAPTQCADLEQSSSQYFNKTSPTGLSFTVTWTAMAWVKLESYVAGGIVARRNASVEGWSLGTTTAGQIEVGSFRIAANNSVTTSYQSLPLGKWVHVAAAVDLAGTTLIYLDGVLVPSATVVTGTAATLVQGTTALVVGAFVSAGTSTWDGKLAQVAVFSSKLSAATIASYMSQTQSGAESTSVGFFSLNSTLNDLNANANNLTAQGGALATATDSPFGQDSNGVTAGTTDYALVMKVSTTTATVQVPEGCTIPTSGGVSAVAYSTATSPFGFTLDKGRWTLITIGKVDLSQASPVNGTWYNIITNGGHNLSLPVGSWDLGYTALLYADRASGQVKISATLSTSNSTESEKLFTSAIDTTPVTATGSQVGITLPVVVAAQTPYYLNVSAQVASITNIYLLGGSSGRGSMFIKAIPSGI